MPSRRPDPETGLIPVEQESLSDVLEPVPMAMTEARAYEPPSIRRTRRSTIQQHRMLANVEYDYRRQMMALHVCQADGWTGAMMVPEVTWRPVEPGVESDHQPFYLDERAAEQLAESMDRLPGRRDERRRWESRHEEDRAEIRSLANQLEQARDRCDDLADQVTFLRRTVRWLEQELRDANRERRGSFDASATPEPPARSEFDG
jgi:hypothetical protein